MKHPIRYIRDTFLHKRLDFRVRLFNVLAMGGTVVGALMALLGIITNAGWGNILANVLGAALAFALLTYSRRTGKYRRCYIISIVAIFLFLFPIFFFSAGGYHSGMPAFFVFAVAFTVFMLDGWRAVLFSALELTVYIGICLIAYFRPENVNFLASETDLLIDIVVAFVVVSIALGVCMFLHFRLYNEQQRELEKTRARLTEENAMLDKINQLKTEFLSNLAHELKTPLTVMSGYAQIAGQTLEDRPELDTTAAQMKLITSEAERLSLMVGQILDVTRIEEGRMVVAPVKKSIVEIIQTTLSTYYPVLNKNFNKLTLQLPEELPLVLADAERVSQVLVNLLSNAIRHTRNGRITVSASESTGYVEIVVADTGEGIPPDRLPTLFERYKSYQNEKPHSGSDTGTGLGLYICRYIVEAHGGEISLQSDVGKGTAARFTVPVDR